MKMAKTNLLALAAGVLISPALMAADVNSATTKYGWADEALGLADTGDVATSGDFFVILNAEYTPGDEVTLAFTGDSLDETTVPTSASAPCVVGGLAGITFGLLSADSSSALFRVTEVDSACGATSTVGKAVLFFPDGQLEFDPDGVLDSNGVTVSFSAATSTGTPIDTGSGPDVGAGCEPNCNARSTDYIQTASLFGIDTDTGPVFDGTVNVETQRLTLIPDPDDEGGFIATINAFPDANFVVDVTFTGHIASFMGPLGWIIDTDTAAGLQPPGGVIDTNVGCAFVPEDSSNSVIVLDCDAGTPSAFLTLDPTANFEAPDTANTTTLAAGSFSVTTVVSYDDNWFGNGNDGSITVSNIDVGEWDLNGFQAELSYTPFGTGISQVIYLANRGSQSGEVTVDYVAQDGTKGSLGVIATLEMMSTLSIGNLIKNALPANLRSFGRLALTITVNVPSCDGQVNAQYNVGGNSRAYTSARDNCDEWDGTF